LSISVELCLKHDDTLWLFACSQKLTLALLLDTVGPVMDLEIEQNEQLQLVHRLLAFILATVLLLLQIGLHHCPSSYSSAVHMCSVVAAYHRVASAAPHVLRQLLAAPAWSHSARCIVHSHTGQDWFVSVQSN